MDVNMKSFSKAENVASKITYLNLSVADEVSMIRKLERFCKNVC